MTLNRWYDHGAGVGGNIIDLALKLGNSTVKDALADILKTRVNSFSFQSQKLSVDNKITPSNIVILKEQPLQNKALIQYAQERGISEIIAKKYCVEVYYKIISTAKHYFSIGFKTNTPTSYALRNKYFKNATSPSGITSIKNGKSKVKVFEGFFDFLSYKMLSIEDDFDFIILNSTSNIKQAEQLFLGYNTVETYLDNDTSSNKLKSTLKERYGSLVVDKSDSYNGFKDLNEMLMDTKFS